MKVKLTVAINDLNITKEVEVDKGMFDPTDLTEDDLHQIVSENIGKVTFNIIKDNS